MIIVTLALIKFVTVCLLMGSGMVCGVFGLVWGIWIVSGLWSAGTRMMLLIGDDCTGFAVKIPFIPKNRLNMYLNVLPSEKSRQKHPAARGGVFW